MKLDCEPGFITLVWTENRAQADTSLFRLGTCFPTSFSPREAVFRVDVNDCNFSRMVCVCVRVKLLTVEFAAASADWVPCMSLTGHRWCHGLLQWAGLYAPGSVPGSALQPPCCLHISEVGAHVNLKWVPQILFLNGLDLFRYTGPKTGTLVFTTRCSIPLVRRILCSIWELWMVGKDTFQFCCSTYCKSGSQSKCKSIWTMQYCKKDNCLYCVKCSYLLIYSWLFRPCWIYHLHPGLPDPHHGWCGAAPPSALAAAAWRVCRNDHTRPAGRQQRVRHHHQQGVRLTQ